MLWTSGCQAKQNLKHKMSDRTYLIVEEIGGNEKKKNITLFI